MTEDTYRLVRDEFARRHLVQDQHLRALAARAEDRRLLAALLARHDGRSPRDPVRLDGAGFFFDEARAPDAWAPVEREPAAREAIDPVAPALVALRARVAETDGPGFIEEAMVGILGQLLELTPETGREPPRDLSAERPPTAAYGFAGRYQDLFVSLLALEALRDARPLRTGSVVGEAGGGPPLDAVDAALIVRLGEALEERLVHLVRSTRPDWGFPFLVGMARLTALDEARRAGRWVFLDAFPSDAPVIAAERIADQPALARALLDEARDDFAVARARIGARIEDQPGFPEAYFVTLEAAGNRLIEITRTVDDRRPLRLPLGFQVPSRDAALVDPIAPVALGAAELAREASRAREHEEAYERELRGLYGYDLINRNCVTEIFRTIDAALATTLPDADEAGVRLESTRRLGGHVEVEHTVNFIPVASARAVRDTYAVSETIEVPSYRLAALARLYRQDNAARVYLRESNTLTSTLYQRNPSDSAFLFFTDDTIAIRPLLGAANIVAGLGVSVAGLFALPVDGGELLRAGLKGVLFSLPELAFFNIRKGSLIYAPRREEPALSPRFDGARTP